MKIFENKINPYNDPNVFCRDIEVEKIIGFLREGRNVFVTGLRRMGKTYLVKHLRLTCMNLPGGEFFPIYIEVGGCDSAVSFYKKLLNAIKETMNGRERLAQTVHARKIEGLSFKDLQIQVKDEKTQLIELIEHVSKGLSSKLVLILDEYPKVLWDTREKDAEQIANFVKEINDSGILRWILTGSTGIHYAQRALYQRKCNIDLLRDTEQLIVSGFDETSYGASFSELICAQLDSSLFGNLEYDFHLNLAAQLDSVPHWITRFWSKASRERDLQLPDQRNEFISKVLEDATDPFSLEQAAGRVEVYSKDVDQKVQTLAVLRFLATSPSPQSLDSILINLPSSSRPQLEEVLQDLMKDHVLLKSGQTYSYKHDLMKKYFEVNQ